MGAPLSGSGSHPTGHTPCGVDGASRFDPSRLAELAARCEAATGPDRELDRAIGYAIGIGAEKERTLYAEMGAAMWTPDQRGLSPYDRARGDTIRPVRVAGTRLKRGYWEDQIIRACDGPRPLTNSPTFTASLDAAMTLVPEGMTFGVFRRVTGEGAGADVEISFHGNAATPALALCAAALRARAAQGIEARQRQDAERLDPKDESPTPKGMRP